ncbi:LytR C-terminal domain-containing protein [Streptomyces sp. NA04227]|nr:LytR C-terminal domain-containing protein [Streptomyces sp. NA04227]
MGRQYRVTGSKYPRMRRPRRRGRWVVAAIASAAALGMVGWGTLQLIDVFSGGGDSASASAPDCGPKASASASASASAKSARPLPEPGRVTVNVFNATPRGGLAKKTADELKKRGFKIGEVGNATKEFDKKVPGTGLLLGSPASLDTSLPVLGSQLPGAQKRADTRSGAKVDLIIGTAFKQLAPKAEAARALNQLAHPAPAPKPSESCH